MNSPEKPNGYNAPAVDRAFRLLTAVANSDEEPRLSDLARALGYSKSTTHGLVHALIAAGALIQDPSGKRFSLGPAIVALAFKDRTYRHLGEQVQPYLDRLRDRVNETVLFGVMDRSRTLILAAAETPKPMKIAAAPGTSIPLLAGAVGKAFLAMADDAIARETIRQQGLPRFTAASITDEKRYLYEVIRVRAAGYAVDQGEYLTGVHAVAVGLGIRSGIPLALWVVGFAESLPGPALETVAGEILTDVASLRRSLGIEADS